MAIAVTQMKSGHRSKIEVEVVVQSWQVKLCGQVFPRLAKITRLPQEIFQFSFP